MEQKKIIVNYYKKDDQKNYKIMNESEEECLICICKLNLNIVILINNYCACFNAVLLCEECFLEWFIKYNKCFVCRELL